MTHPFNINFLDHVAIRVSNIEISANWYTETLGLIRVQPKEWHPYPIFMMAGKTGVALFPADLNDDAINLMSRNIKIDHFAFNIEPNQFEKAKTHLDTIGLNYKIQNHLYFVSIYIKDPDGHTVELTSLTDKETNFYNNYL